MILSWLLFIFQNLIFKFLVYIFPCIYIYIHMYLSRYIEKLLDKLSKNIILICSGGLYAPIISHFLKRRFAIRIRVSLSPLCKFSCFTEMISLTCMLRLPPQLFQSSLSIIYPAKQDWQSRKELPNLISDTKDITNALTINVYGNSNLFLR